MAARRGGYVVINQTEALVAIDVNTGRYVGKRRLEETIVKTNLDAVREIVRQIRLRDLGRDHRRRLHRHGGAQEPGAGDDRPRAGAPPDRAPSKVLSVNEFGLVEITRKRQRSPSSGPASPAPTAPALG